MSSITQVHWSLANVCGVSRIIVQLRNPTQYITPKPEEE